MSDLAPSATVEGTNRRVNFVKQPGHQPGQADVFVKDQLSETQAYTSAETGRRKEQSRRIAQGALSRQQATQMRGLTHQDRMFDRAHVRHSMRAGAGRGHYASIKPSAKIPAPTSQEIDHLISQSPMKRAPEILSRGKPADELIKEQRDPSRLAGAARVGLKVLQASNFDATAKVAGMIVGALKPKDLQPGHDWINAQRGPAPRRTQETDRQLLALQQRRLQPHLALG